MGTRSSSDHGNDFRTSMVSRINTDMERRRAEERALEETEMEAEFGGLKVGAVEFYALQNAKQHNTDKYELVQGTSSHPVLRRAQHFFVALRFKDRAFDSEVDNLRLIFKFGARPSVTKGTKVILPIAGSDEGVESKSQWSAKVIMESSNTIQLQIEIPNNVPVGMWKCTVQTSLKSDSSQKQDYDCKEDIYILFNPWSENDSVYMPNNSWRDEYVLNDTGKVWVGTYKRSRGRKWVFGQFDDAVLPAAVYVLELANLKGAERANPVKVVRALSAAVNSIGEDGVLVGRWDGVYGDGVAPYVWTGSVAILEQYIKSGGQPVKYGQCWVFSAVTTTICRALGIPCRSVTNFISAHDTNSSLTIDKFFDANGEEIEGGPDGDNFDSIWNFHVWNDAWMARPDLPAGYGGWQAIDATPQEESDGGFRCGPASIEAVRKGQVGFGYDVPFVFSEVNADVCHWKEDVESYWGFSLMKSSQYHVGRKILTKHPERDDDQGELDEQNILNEYKNREGSSVERLAIMNAVRGVDTAQQYFSIPSKRDHDVKFDLVEIDQIKIGEPFRIVVNITNKSDEQRTIQAMLSCCSVYYTGVKGSTIKQQSGYFVMNPKQEESISISVHPQEYLGKLVDYAMMKMYTVASVKETKQSWSEEDDFVAEKPVLDIQTSIPTGKVNQVMEATFSFTNPLSMTLTYCRLSYEGPGLQRPRFIRIRNVGPGEEMKYTVRLLPRSVGQKKIIGTFTSYQLVDITGSKTINVAE